jgi:hypothetical protein
MKVVISCSEKFKDLLIQVIATLEGGIGERADVQFIGDPIGFRGPTVQYRAVAGKDALDALGATTVNGIIFTHLLESGPCTVKQIRETRPYSDKAVQSIIHRLKHMGLVVAEPIGTTL